MAKRTFKATLSQNGINKLIKDLENYRDNILPQKLREVTEILATEGVVIAKANIQKCNAVFTDELKSSIIKEFGLQTKTRCIFYVVADSEHAVFVEFGTGQMGKEAPYPYPFPLGISWQYNTGQTIFEVSPGQYGWFYQRDGSWYFTQGMPARPFMYETAAELYSKVVKVVRKVFAS